MATPQKQMRALTQKRTAKRQRRIPDQKRRADHTRTLEQKELIRQSNETLWWERTDAELPPLPLPAAKIADEAKPAAKILAIKAMQEWGVQLESSRASGMGRWQLQREMKNDSDFKQSMVSAKRECFERVEREMIKRAQYKGGDLAAIFTMKNNMRRYREVSRVELTGKDGAPLNQVDAMKAELLERLGKLAGSEGSRGRPGSGGSAGSGEIVIEAGSQPRLVAGDPLQVTRVQKRRAAKG